MAALPLALLALLAAAPLPAPAARVPFTAHTLTQPFRPRGAGDLAARADVAGSTQLNGSIPIRNVQNTIYISTIGLNGVNKSVMLDTGSSDLWVTGDVPNAVDSGKAATLSYAVGRAAGDINFATFTFDDYSVDKQAFLLVKDTSDFSTNITAQGYDGLMGLGPNSGSVIERKLDQDAAGDSPLNRIFNQNSSTQNYMTFLLDRVNAPGQSFTGQMTLQEVVPTFANVTSMPKLDVNTVHKLTKRDQHWQVPIDDNGVIGPDGQPIPYKSIVHGADHRLVAVLDTGFTFPQVPRKMSDAIYGRVPGAVYDVDAEIWTIPCDIEVNLTFVFGGVKYPIHPLDVSNDDFSSRDSAGNHVCLGAFQPISSAFSLLGEYDIILGMSFLRNAYTLMDFGDFLENSNTARGDPFVQMLPLTDPAKAHQDWVQKRLNGVDTSGDAAHALLPPDQAKSSPQSDAEKKAQLEGKVLRQWPYIFVGCFVLVCGTVGFIVWRCCCGARAKARGGGCCGRRGGKAKDMGAGAGMPMSKYEPLGGAGHSTATLNHYDDPYRK